MTRRTGLIALVTVTVAVAGLAIAYYSIRRAAERRFANLSACLLGDPLADGETAMERYRAIELARPYERLKLEFSGIQSQWVPENPIPLDQKWPTRCKRYAEAFSRSYALRFAASYARDQAIDLAKNLEAEHAPSLDVLWQAARPVANPRVRPDSDVVRPWAPVKLLREDELFDVAGCGVSSRTASIDGWDRESVMLGGKSDCSVSAGADGRPLAHLELGKKLVSKNQDKLTKVWDANVLGHRLQIENGIARIALPDSPPVELGPADAFWTCNGGATRVVLIQSHSPSAFEVRFVDERGVSAPARVEQKAPNFPGRGKTAIWIGALSLNCRDREARVSWAWSTLVDQVQQHVIVSATCTPGHCELRAARASIPTLMGMNCGYCDFDPDLATIVSPTVVDLFEAVALVWSTGITERTRIAPLERLHETPDIVLRDKRDPSGVDTSVIARGSVALVAIASGKPTYLFRLDAEGGASALSGSHR